MSYLKTLIKISRIRFWLYLGGTYIVGYSYGLSPGQFWDILNPVFFIFFIYFMIPANIFLYGINDYYDRDTDSLNPKKDEKEYRAEQKTLKILKISLWVTFIISLSLFFLLSGLTAKIFFVIFILLAAMYSMKPFRFKARPFIDFASNILYGMPGFLGFYQSSGTLPDWEIVLAVGCWTGAMHLFSAVPDIEFDKKVGVFTTAVLFGKNYALLLTFFLWMVSGMLVLFSELIYPWSLVLLIYPLMPLVLLLHKSLPINTVYWFYPYINGFAGFLFFINAVYRNYYPLQI